MEMQSRIFLAGLLSVGVCVAGMAGCNGPSKTEVTGKVTLNGKALDDGDITFAPDADTTAPTSSAPIRNGEYKLSGEFGLDPGTYLVRINGYRPPTDKSNMLAGGGLDKPPETVGVPAREQFLPEKFNAKTTLEKLVVAPGQSKVEKDYDLKP